MKRFWTRSMLVRTGAVALPVALAVSAAPASAQWSSQRVPQQYPQQRYPRQGYPVQQNHPVQQTGYGQQELFEWQGPVDRELRVEMRGGRGAVVPMGRSEWGTGQFVPVSAVPGQDGIVTVQTIAGRGRVDVIEQPSANNGYTAVVRLRDPQGGAGNYRVAAYWQPIGGYGPYRNRGQARAAQRRGQGRWGRGQGQGRWRGQDQQGEHRGGRQDGGDRGNGDGGDDGSRTYGYERP